MQVTTTPGIEGGRITRYCGIVAGEAILGANVFKDVFAGIRDLVGGRSATYERELQRARDIALQEMQDKAIEHSRCMREHGIDMPDPVFDSSGGGAMVRIGEVGKGGIDFDSEEFQEASEACGEIFGGAIKGVSGGKASAGFSVATPSGGSK